MPAHKARAIQTAKVLQDARLKCAPKARKYAEKFSWNDCFKRQLALYKEIADKKSE